MTSPTLISFSGPADLVQFHARLPTVFLTDAKASERFWEFFVASIRKKNTRRAYYKATCRFSEWCEGRGLFDLATVKSIHVAAFIEDVQQTHPGPL